MKIEPSTSLRDYTSLSLGAEGRARGGEPRTATTAPMSVLGHRCPNLGPEVLNTSPRVEFPKGRRLVTVGWPGVSTTRGGRARAPFLAACLALACGRDAERWDAPVELPRLARAAEGFQLRYILGSCMYGTTPLAEILPEVARSSGAAS